MEAPSTSAPAADGSYRWMDSPEAPQHLLMRDLRRHGVKLYGTRWCLNCRQQKAMLYQLADRSGWKDMYVDCDLLLNSLETAYIKQVPAWKVGNEYHLGMQSEETLRALVDKVGGQKKAWKTGGAAQWQRRHRQRAAWAKQEYAVLVREAIARGKEAAAASKATRQISPHLAEMHPPQPTPQSAALLSNAATAPGVTVLRTSGVQARPPAEADAIAPVVAGSQLVPRPLPPAEPAVANPQQFIRFKPVTPGSFRDQLRLRGAAFPPLHERVPILARWRENRMSKPVGAGREHTQAGQEAGPVAPLGWFRDRFTDTDYGQLFEAVAKVRLLALPQLLAVPRLLKPAFARASSAVEPVAFASRRQSPEVAGSTPRESTEKQSWLREDRSFTGWDIPRSLSGARKEGLSGASKRAGESSDSSRRPWWRSMFSR
ncbi:hypothetical protein KFL_007270060 [Klebsormidium nitens]|uniref:Glutaredoxin domain-containing protein n=1 Tax=Klebsormidium nitens TaxID=105231 RepID=A0A1Y1INP4_KLENI|nr:hypothetical protein KFL_007270060 [Klebsormidium nitens]|eukprot:GAQ91099.1 hypothetical protein KFL_007270060 [Klebsormidium nitens]